MRKYTLDRWNWSDKAQKWVYVSKGKNGRRKYIYNIDPPKRFIELSMEIKKINDIMLKTEDADENNKLFLKLMNISNRMQNMRMEDL